LPAVTAIATSDEVVCCRCKRICTVELHGGRWCARCGCFASPPDPALLPSKQPSYVEPVPREIHSRAFALVCGWCNQPADMSHGIYDDGEWMCGGCIGDTSIRRRLPEQPPRDVVSSSWHSASTRRLTHQRRQLRRLGRQHPGSLAGSLRLPRAESR
jgi:hypothetical protein